MNKTLKLAFLIDTIIILTICYLAIIRGTFDRFILKEINNEASVKIKWKDRRFLDFKEIEVVKDNNYFRAPVLTLRFKPFLMPLPRFQWFQLKRQLKIYGLAEFENGYASRGQEIICKNISAKAPFEFLWPGKCGFSGEAYINCDEAKMEKVKFLNPALELILDGDIVIIKKLKGDIFEGPLSLRGKADIKRKNFAIFSKFDTIELETLSAVINQEKFAGKGKWRGEIKLDHCMEKGFRGEGGFDLISNGEIKTAFLKGMIQKMPDGEAKKRLMEGLGKDEYFSLTSGSMSFNVRGEDMAIKLILEGKKGLLDFTVNMPMALIERFGRKFI